jgi:GntR family transcriptional regulator/MocR family aminotransferase
VQGLAPEHVVYAGTASKTLAPGLRLAWLALPAALIEDVVAAKALADRQSSAIDQLTLAEFIRSGPMTATSATRGSPTGAAATVSSCG